jgi:hypothetical protein
MTPKSLPLVEEWVAWIRNDSSMWDQAAFNLLVFRNQTVPSEAERPDRTFLCASALGAPSPNTTLSMATKQGLTVLSCASTRGAPFPNTASGTFARGRPLVC